MRVLKKEKIVSITVDKDHPNDHVLIISIDSPKAFDSISLNAIAGSVCASLNPYLDGCMDGRTNGRVNELKDGWMEGWMNE